MNFISRYDYCFLSFSNSCVQSDRQCKQTHIEIKPIFSFRSYVINYNLAIESEIKKNLPYNK